MRLRRVTQGPHSAVRTRTHAPGSAGDPGEFRGRLQIMKERGDKEKQIEDLLQGRHSDKGC